MSHGPTRLLSFPVIAALILTVLAGVHCGDVRAAAAAERSLTAAQIGKINALIADKGRDVAVSALITDILGLTRNDETISSRAFAAADTENGNDIHQIYLLPQGRGYLEGHFYQDKVEVYWLNRDFVLIAALSGVRGEKPAQTSFQEAQFGFGKELAWWAKFTDQAQ
jgi:hypothetical protein